MASQRGAGLSLEATIFGEVSREGVGGLIETGLHSFTDLSRDTDTTGTGAEWEREGEGNRVGVGAQPSLHGRMEYRRKYAAVRSGMMTLGT